MSENTLESRINKVYSATSVAELRKQYDGWAVEYDDDMQAMGRPAPAIVAGLLTRYLRRGGPVLDVGAGTGIMGEYLKLLGYRDLEALDISKGMLEVAREKGVYKRLHQAALGTEMDLPDDRYAGIVGVGVFTMGHAAPESLEELVRVAKPGGVMAFTVSRPAYDKGYGAKQDRLEHLGLWDLLEVTPPFKLHPNRRDSAMAQGFAYRVNG